MALVDRVKAILLTPKQEWAVIDTEPASTGSLFKNYAVPLAAIPALAYFIGLSVIGLRFMGVSVRVPMENTLPGAIVHFLGALAGAFVLGLVIDALAPTFGGQKNQIQALKVAVYSSTAAWLAGIFFILPNLAVLSLVGLYSLYLLYLGLPVLMKVAEDKALPYTIVVILVGIVISIIVREVAKSVVGIPGQLGP